MRQRVLYVGAFVPDDHGKHAGARAAQSNIDTLRRDRDVDVIVCTTEATASEPSGARVIEQGVARFAAGVVRHARDIGWPDLLVANVLHARINPRFIDEIAHALATGRYAEMFVDFTQAIRPALIARKMSAQPVKLTCCLHDIYAQKFLRRPGFYACAAQGLISRAELRLLQEVEHIRVLNPKDESILRSLYSLKHISVAEFKAPDWAQRVNRSGGVRRPFKLVCYGNFHRPENAEAALLLAREVMPPVLQAFPDSELQLLGTGSIEFHQRHRLPRHVVALGFVDDPSAFFGECACVAAPLVSGAGVKFKVLDCLAAGVPVIGTPIAFEGIEATELMHESPLAEFSQTVVDYLLELQRQATASTAAA